jgi:hypothetical protein
MESVCAEGEVERSRLLHDHQLDSHLDVVLEQLLRDVPQRPEQSRHSKERQLQHCEPDDPLDRG